jgi:prepilin-type N-terminal cleavage/methylation domain-containing protein
MLAVLEKLNKKQKMIKRRKEKSKKNDQRGFSLIEILIVTVITTGVFTVIYSFYASTIKQEVESRYEMIASNLAQEGVEIIRNIRDENIMEGAAINEGINSLCYPYFDATTGATACVATPEISIVGERYVNSSSGEGTPFTRTCKTNYNPTLETLEVECIVEWKSFVNSSLTRNSKAKVFLTNWQ